jgi:hypothetical protein
MLGEKEKKEEGGPPFEADVHRTARPNARAHERTNSSDTIFRRGRCAPLLPLPNLRVVYLCTTVMHMRACMYA